MARPATGAVAESRNAAGGVNRSLRFTPYGKRRRLPLGPVSLDEAERRLRHLLADVERDGGGPVAGARATVDTAGQRPGRKSK
jgi:hypothetical protein